MQTLESQTFQTLKELYPLDWATGYKTGELRGVFVVEVAWPLRREQARRLPAQHQ